MIPAAANVRRSVCGAYLAGMQHELPRRKVKPASTAVHHAAMVIWRRGRVFLRQCDEGERWAGLWDFPRFELQSRRAAGNAGELVEQTRRLTQLTVRPGSRLATIKHGVTRYRITLQCYAADWIAGEPPQKSRQSCRWLKVGQLDDYPLSTTGRKISQLLMQKN